MNDSERAKHIRRAEASVRDAIASIFRAQLHPHQWKLARTDVRLLREVTGNLNEYADTLEWRDMDEEQTG
jgi:hypothetical protein